jgi:hypothetical protein
MTQPPQSLQFSLKSIFALTTFVAVLVWLVPAAANTRVPAMAYYTVVGLAQLACAPIVYQQLRTTGPFRARPNEQPYELALVGLFFTLGTWVLMLIWIVSEWAGTRGFWPLGLILALAAVGVLLHLPTLCLNLLGLFVMRDWWRDGALTLLFLLNIINTLLVFGIVASGAGEPLGHGLGLAAPG